MKKNAIQSILIYFYKAQVQVDSGLPQKLDTLKLIEKKWGRASKHMVTREKFPDQYTSSLCFKIKNWQIDLIHLQSFCKANDIVNRTKQQPIDLGKIFINPTSDRGLIFIIYKELKKLDTREPNNPIKNGVQS